MSTLPFNTPYNRTKRAVVHSPVSPHSPVTSQSPADQLLIHQVLDRVKRGQPLPSLAQRGGFFADTTLIPSDYQTALNFVIAARRDFDSLPAKVRSRFRDDPSALLAFLQDPANKNEAISLGLLSAPVAVPSPAPAPSGVSTPA